MTRLRMRFTGAVSELSDTQRRELFDRVNADESTVLTVSSLIEIVRRDADEGLRALAREFDRVPDLTLEVALTTCQRALDRLDPALRRAMERSMERLQKVHGASRPSSWEVEVAPGLVVGRRPDALDRVGVYAPGGRSPYPSSVLMGVVPARVAGVREVVLCSPPGANGKPPEVVLAAAALTGVDRVFSIGGGGAIAAMACGTQTVPRVDLIVGPGNMWVTEAKAQVSRAVAIDLLAGPSELLVIADEHADLRVVAREMLAQAEHDPRACVVAVVTGDGRGADRLVATLNEMPIDAGRRRVTMEAFESGGGVLHADSLQEAITFGNSYAPEHLLLAVADPVVALADVRNAGTVCLGETTSVTFGDYATGANHVLPTGGLARSSSGLSTEHFVRWTGYQRVSREAAGALASDVALLAAAEGLRGHAAAAEAWEVRA